MTHLEKSSACLVILFVLPGVGLAAEAPVAVDDAASIDTSFPGFTDLMNGLGAQLGGAP